MRLDKYLSSVSDFSRKQARALIRTGEVRVNGLVSLAHDAQVDENCTVTCEGRSLRKPGFRYFMLHKPGGVICATRDSHQPTVIDLLDEDKLNSLQIAGRLDKDTTGLVLITDDGKWNHRLTSPSGQCHKVYQLTTAYPIDPGTIELFQRGIVLQPENKRTLPARLSLLESRHAQLVLSEGKYHQIKRMMVAAGNEVLTLHRSAVGEIELDNSLEPGGYRPLTPAEIASV